MNDQVDILLATYQGGAYLQEQLQSLMQQSYPHFHIFIRDDGSTDQTLSILESFRQTYPQQITLIPAIQRLGVKGNFSELMQHAQAPYIMFSDQDDVWLPHKIEWSLLRLKKMEKEYGAHLPLLLHTDLQVVNSDLTLIDPSFWNYSHLNPSLTNLHHLIVRNHVTGCALIMNQALLQKSYPIPSQAIMHDWWIALVAAALGKIDYLQESTLLYRQHGHNQLGAKKFSYWRAIKNLFFRKKNQNTYPKQDQAQQILERYAAVLNPLQKESLYAFCSLKNLSYPRKVLRCLRYGFIPLPIKNKSHKYFN